MNAIPTAIALALWLPLALVLARRAESRFSPIACVPWRAATACAGVVAVVACFRPPATGIACGVACVALVVAAFADARTGYLFDAITLPAGLLSAGVAVAFGSAAPAAAGVLVLVALFGSLTVWSKGRLMGLGDVKAMYAIGAAFGPTEAVFAIFAACVSGVATSLISGRFRRGAEIRFGPHLAAGSTIALVAGDRVVHGMLGL
jgi:prepilin signal peptidase PulO-like enzyme (type II secretory pathway)